MVYCSAVGCNNDSRYVGRKQGVSYHRFPTDDKLLKEWLAKLSRLDLVVTKDSRVCSLHFEPECYKRDLKAELLGLNLPNIIWSQMQCQQFSTTVRKRSRDYHLRGASRRDLNNFEGKKKEFACWSYGTLLSADVHKCGHAMLKPAIMKRPFAVFSHWNINHFLNLGWW